MNTACLRFHLLIFRFMLRTIQDNKPPTISHLMDKPKIEQFYYLNESKFGFACSATIRISTNIFQTFVGLNFCLRGHHGRQSQIY